MPLFSSLETKPVDPVLGVAAAFRTDPNPNKINLGVGAYRDENGKPYLLKSVEEAERRLLDAKTYKEYLPIDGDSTFIQHTEKLLFGDSLPSQRFSAQTPGATGALAVGAQLLSRVLDKRKVFFSNPTWPNHLQIFSAVAFDPHFYPYYNPQTHLLDREAFFATFGKMEQGTPFVIQACCHNPSGIDLTWEDWKRLADLVEKRQLFPFFDIAYQGFGTDLNQDAAPLRLFASRGIEMLVAYSYSKNMGLYGDRTGMLSVIGEGKGIPSQVKAIIRTLYSSPPLHGSLIVNTVLGDAVLKKQWIEELGMMRQRILHMRAMLASNLPQISFISGQAGMFSFTGLSKEQVIHLKERHALYMLEDGRINVAGLTEENLPLVTEAIRGVL